MAFSSHRGHWEAPIFRFNSPNQSGDWSVFYTRALDYLDALDIELETDDQSRKGWKQLKLMFEGEDRKALQSLIDSGVVTPEHMLNPKAALDAIGTTIKSEEHFWAYRDELVLDLQQQSDEGIHVLSQRIGDLISKSKFGNAQTSEAFKLVVLQHTVRYHEARDWIRQQDQSQLTYQALLSHCKMLEAHCEQYQKAKERGCADLASITAATSSLHIDAMSKSQSCIKCGYSHPNSKCPAKGQQCYACNGFNHYTALCQKKGCRQPRQKQQRGFEPNKHSSSHGRRASCSPHRHRGRNHRSRSHSRTPSHSPSHCPTHGTSPKCSTHSKKHSTSHRYHQDSIDVIPADSITTGSQAEGMLFTERASDGQVAFYTRLDLPARSGTKTMVVKIDPDAQVNTIPLSRYHTLYPNHISKSRYSKAKSLQPTNHTWMSNDGLPKPFLGHFVTEVSHMKEPRTYPIRFYVFEDATNPPCLLSYATSERLGIVQFQVPNLAATIPLDQVAVQTPGSKRKTAQKVTFQDPICEIEGPTHTATPQMTAVARGRPQFSTRVKKHKVPTFPRPPVLKIHQNQLLTRPSVLQQRSR